MQYYTLTNECHLFTSKGYSFIDDVEMLEDIAKDRPQEVNWNANDLAKEFHDQASTIKKVLKEKREKLQDLITREQNIKNWVYKNCKPKDMDYREWYLTFVYVTVDKYSLELFIDKLEKVLFYMKKRIDYTSDKIDVERARQRPISDFIRFDRSGFATSIWNTSDKTPSMKYYKKNNRVHCFSTGEDEDVIGVVMQLHGCTFIEAVKIINN